MPALKRPAAAMDGKEEEETKHVKKAVKEETNRVKKDVKEETEAADDDEESEHGSDEAVLS